MTESQPLTASSRTGRAQGAGSRPLIRTRRRPSGGVGTLLLLRVLLGLEPDGDELAVDPVLPDAIGEIELRNIPGRWGRAEASAREAVRA